MNIESVKSQDNGYLVNGSVFVPNDTANRHYSAVQTWILTGNTPESNTKTLNERKQEVKLLAQEKINELAPEWKQRNATARALELVDKLVGGGALTSDEQAEKAAIDALWVQVKTIRAHSDTLETALESDIDTDITVGW